MDWEHVFNKIAPELAPAMAADTEHVPCPVHGGTDGFRLFGDWRDKGGGVCNTCGGFASGYTLLSWLKDKPRDAIVEEVRAAAKGSVRPRVAVPVAPKVKSPEDCAMARRLIERDLAGARPIRGSLGATYLQARGIFPENIPDELLFHPRMYFKDTVTRTTGRLPAILARVYDEKGAFVALHITYLDPSGQKKASITKARKLVSMVPRLQSAAVRLIEPEGAVLGVAEGIETALAAYAISRIPVWAVLNTSLMAKWDPPPGVTKVIIWADKDAKNAGLIHAEILATRLEQKGLQVEIQLPPVPIPPETPKGVDWLDVLLSHGILAFPPKYRRWRPAPGRAQTGT